MFKGQQISFWGATFPIGFFNPLGLVDPLGLWDLVLGNDFCLQSPHSGGRGFFKPKVPLIRGMLLVLCRINVKSKIF